jgi:hypothetical protein
MKLRAETKLYVQPRKRKMISKTETGTPMTQARM